MSTGAQIGICAAVAVAALCLSWLGIGKAAFDAGRKIGHDEGWNECELDHIANEHRRNYARRNPNGTFKEVKK